MSKSGGALKWKHGLWPSLGLLTMQAKNSSFRSWTPLSGHDFIKDKEGHYAEIREEKVVIMQQKLEMKNQSGETIYVSRPPVELDPKFFTALKKHVTLSAARKIMKYIMEVCNETMKHAEQAVCATSFELASEQLRFPNRFCCAPSLYAHPEAPRL